MNNEASNPQTAAGRQTAVLVTAAVVIAALAGWLPVLKAWWFGDDWRLLAAAAGLPVGSAAESAFPGPMLYWRIMYPVFGLATVPYTLTRLALHAGSALLVTRLARRTGAGETPSLLAGLIYAVAPTAFVTLYPAAGVTPLLGTFLGLWALERWLTEGGRNTALVALLGLLSMLCGTAALALPVLLAVTLRATGMLNASRSRSLVVAVVATGAVTLATLTGGSFRPDSEGALTLPAFGRHLLAAGRALIGLAPDSFPRLLNAPLATGAVPWLLWMAAAVWSWRRHDRAVAVALLAALGSVIATILLQVEMIYAPPTAAAALTVALFLRQTRLAQNRLSPTLLLAIVAVVVAASWGGASLRLSSRDVQGRPSDPRVRQAAVSYSASHILKELPRDVLTDPEGGLTFLQSPPPGELDELASRLGDDWVVHSGLYDALAGIWGPRLILGNEVAIAWRNNLKRGPLDALVLVDTELGALHWGSARQALAYVTLTHVAQGRFESARLHLLRASLIAGDNLTFYYDPGLMIVEARAVAAAAAEFLTWLDAPDKTTIEVRGLQTNFVNLLRTVAGEEAAAAAMAAYREGG